MNKEQYRRGIEIDAEIARLEREITKLEQEKRELVVPKIKEAIPDFPVRVRTALQYVLVLNILQLETFLAGNYESRDNYFRKAYKNAKTPKERLKLLRNVGEINAAEAVEMFENYKKENGLV